MTADVAPLIPAPCPRTNRASFHVDIAQLHQLQLHSLTGILSIQQSPPEDSFALLTIALPLSALKLLLLFP